MGWINVDNLRRADFWVVVNQDGIMLKSDTTLTLSEDSAMKYDNIGDAMKAAIKVNELGKTNKFRILPCFFS